MGSVGLTLLFKPFLLARKKPGRTEVFGRSQCECTEEFELGHPGFRTDYEIGNQAINTKAQPLDAAR